MIVLKIKSKLAIWPKLFQASILFTLTVELKVLLSAMSLGWWLAEPQCLKKGKSKVCIVYFISGICI